MKKFKRRSARMNLRHFHVILRRYFKQIFTNVGTLLPLILEPLAMLIILLCICEKDSFVNKGPADITPANVTIFVMVVMAALMGILNSYREICKERDVLAREVFGGLDVTAYTLSKSTVLCIVGAVQCVVLFFGSLVFINFNFPNPLQAYPLCLLALVLTNVCVTNLGLLVSATLKKSESAILPVLIIIIVQVVFSDTIIELKGAAELIKYITPSTWGIAILGHECALNEWGWLSKDMYGLNPLIPLAVLAGLSLLLLAMTVWKLKRVYRQKD